MPCYGSLATFMGRRDRIVIRGPNLPLAATFGFSFPVLQRGSLLSRCCRHLTSPVDPTPHWTSVSTPVFKHTIPFRDVFIRATHSSLSHDGTLPHFLRGHTATSESSQSPPASLAGAWTGRLAAATRLPLATLVKRRRFVISRSVGGTGPLWSSPLFRRPPASPRAHASF